MTNHRQNARLLSNLYLAIEKNGGVECETAADNYYPEDVTDDPITRQLAIDTAKAICKVCPIKDLCLDYALTTREGFGIWGGLTAEERRQILLTRG